MVVFSKFEGRNDSHRKLADEGAHVMFFTEQDSTIRYGFLLNKDIPINGCPDNETYEESTIIYNEVHGECSLQANGVLLSEIKLRGQWEEL